MLKVLNDIMKV